MIVRRTLVVAGLLATLCLATQAQAQSKAAPAGAVEAAQTSALAWLGTIDAGNYAQSWKDSSALFQKAVGATQWEDVLKQVRTPLGAVKERKLKSATFTTSLPNVPPGEYVMIQFDTQFANKPNAVETVTPMLEPDGKWRVAGYFIK
jgi:hypothetical protein